MEPIHCNCSVCNKTVTLTNYKKAAMPDSTIYRQGMDFWTLNNKTKTWLCPDCPSKGSSGFNLIPIG